MRGWWWNDELRCWNYVVGTTLFLLRNSYCVIGRQTPFYETDKKNVYDIAHWRFIKVSFGLQTR